MQSARFDRQLDEFLEVSSDGGVGRKYQESSKVQKASAYAMSIVVVNAGVRNGHLG